MTRLDSGKAKGCILNILNSEIQQEAFDKFSRLKCGAIFASMGTGKTKVALDLAAAKMEQGKCDYVMYIAPANMIDSGTVQTEREYCRRAERSRNV